MNITFKPKRFANRMLSASLASLACCVLCYAAPAQGIKRINDPAISPDGTSIAFSYQGDIWTMSSEGGMAVRLTRHPADETFPVFSPDGQKIAFASNRYGSLDVYTMNADGTNVSRLTHHSTDLYPMAFSPDGQTIYGYGAFWGRLNLYKIPIGGGDPIALTTHPYELSYYPSISPDGTKVAYNLGGSPGQWRREGQSQSNIARIVIADNGVPATNHVRIAPSEHYDLFPIFVAQNRLAFISNRSGAPNVWTMNTDGREMRRLTNFLSGTIRRITSDASGGKIAFQKDSALWVLNVASGEASEIEIIAPADEIRNSVERFNITSGLSDYDVSPDGLRAVIEVRGNLFLIPAGGGTTRQLTHGAGREFNPRWLDEKTILYTGTDGTSKRELRTVDLDGNVTLFMSDPNYDLHSAQLSPDRKRLAVHRGLMEIVVLDVESKEELAKASGAFRFTNTWATVFSWSPDSNYIAYSTYFARGAHVAVMDVRTGRENVIAKLARSPSEPRFLGNGKGVFFTASLGLDYRETRDGFATLYLVDLVPQPLKFDEDDLDTIGVDQPEEPSEVTIEIQMEGIEDRMRKLTNSSTSAHISRGNIIYANVGGQLQAINSETGSASPIASVSGGASNLKHFPGINAMYLINQGQLRSLDTRNNNLRTHAFRADFEVDVYEEERALFAEIWWTMDRLFYDPATHGRDWAAVKAEYAELVPYAYSRSDFYNLMNEMVHRLDASHLGTSTQGDYSAPNPDNTAFLGVEWDYKALEQGRYVVGKVIANTPAAHPESRLMLGDQILRVDGTAPTQDRPLSALMNRKSGQKTTLTIRRGSSERSIDIRPQARGAVGGTLYREYVRWNREQVEKLSNGRLGYVHIQGMNNSSLDTYFTESIVETMDREALVIDVRNNGGGYTARMILDSLTRQPWMFRRDPDLPGVQISDNFDGNALELPAIALINQHSFSNAEMFAQGFRSLNIGPIVGEPTGGGVIWTWSLGLWDGGNMRLPSAGVFNIEGENLEGQGRKPDYHVDYDPNAWLQGRDLQIEKAVEVMLSRLPASRTVRR